MENQDNIRRAVQEFMWVAYYNGHLEEVNDIYESLNDPKAYGIVQRPEKWEKRKDYGIEEFCGIFWAWLVRMFGDYRSSPGFGWIDKENVPYLIEVFEDFKRLRLYQQRRVVGNENE